MCMFTLLLKTLFFVGLSLGLFVLAASTGGGGGLLQGVAVVGADGTAGACLDDDMAVVDGL